jgi:hypothetical protein
VKFEIIRTVEDPYDWLNRQLPPLKSMSFGFNAAPLTKPLISPDQLQVLSAANIRTRDEIRASFGLSGL